MNCWDTMRANTATAQPVTVNANAKNVLDLAISSEEPAMQVNVQRLSGNGIRPSGRKDAAALPVKSGADDIVFSSWRHEAVRTHHTDGAGTNETARKYKAYLGDDYYALAWPTTLRTFKNNLETIHQYSDTGFKLIMNGEIGRYENVRYVEQSNIVKGISTDGINGTPWVNAQSDWIFFFGNDTVAEAVAVPEEMRGKIPYIGGIAA